MLISSGSYNVSSKNGNGLLPVYKFISQEDQYQAQYSLSKNTPDETYKFDGVAWFTKRVPNSFKAVCKIKQILKY